MFSLKFQKVQLLNNYRCKLSKIGTLKAKKQARQLKLEKTTTPRCLAAVVRRVAPFIPFLQFYRRIIQLASWHRLEIYLSEALWNSK